MKHTFLYLIWKNPVNRRNYEVGKLTREDGYKFEYSNEYKQALEDGWELIQAFPEVREYYVKNCSLFFRVVCRIEREETFKRY